MRYIELNGATVRLYVQGNKDDQYMTATDDSDFYYHVSIIMGGVVTAQCIDTSRLVHSTVRIQSLVLVPKIRFVSTRYIRGSTEQP
jgi:hypothetical protein